MDSHLSEEMVRQRQRYVCRIGEKYGLEDQEGTHCRGSFMSD